MIKNTGNVLVAGEDVSRRGMNNFPEHFRHIMIIYYF